MINSYPIRFGTTEDQPYLFDIRANPNLDKVKGGERVHFYLDPDDQLRAYVVCITALDEGVCMRMCALLCVRELVHVCACGSSRG